MLVPSPFCYYDTPSLLITIQNVGRMNQQKDHDTVATALGEERFVIAGPSRGGGIALTVAPETMATVVS